jgi:Protein of unknown function (DUF3105)
VSHRREQKEALRREREERERQAREAGQRKKLVGYGAAGALILAVILVLVLAMGGDDGGAGGGPDASSDVFPGGGSVPEQVAFEVEPAARAAGCELESVKGSGTQDHTTSPDEKVKYDTNPPSSGRHFQIPAEDGAYGEAPSDETVVHALEHGRVVVWFKPGLSEDQRADLKAWFDRDEGFQTLLVPRTDMPYQLAATAWNGDPAPNGTGRLMTCDEVNEKTWDALQAFADEHRSRGPEPVP